MLYETEIPKEIRHIFSEWAADFDAGEKKTNMATPGYQRGEIGAFFRALTIPTKTAFLAPDVLAQIRSTATFNAKLSPVASLRKEGQAVLDWLDTINKTPK